MVLGDEHLPTPPTRRRLRLPLSTAEDLRREAARVYREAREGVLDTGVASKLTYMLLTLSRMIETSDLERRIEKLEDSKEADR